MTRLFDWCGDNAGKSIEELSDILRQPSAVVLLPTETVYGLSGRVSDPGCAEKIFLLKHRDPAKHLGWFVPDIETLERSGGVLNDTARHLAEKYMPGPLTLIVNNTSGGTTGFRIPDHPLLLELLKRLNEPLYQTSANRSGFPDAVSCDAALAMLNGTVDAAVDGGVILNPTASTIVDCTQEIPKVLRQGILKIEEL